MPVLLLPDLFAIVFLTCVVALVRRNSKHDAAGLWTAGLVLIVLEGVARLLYVAPSPPLWHHVWHAAALDSYCLAGVIFLRSAVPSLRRMPHSWFYLGINTLPHLLMMTVYGMDLKAESGYRALSVAGLIIGVLTAVAFRRGWRDVAAFCAIWLPLIVATSHANFRIAIYLSLFLLFSLIAVAFAVNLPRASKGRLLIAGGFGAWALCFATHPWIATWGPTSVQLASEVWDLQKFLITVGFVLLLFESQVWNTERLALHDQLTGLPNRRLYDDRQEQALARAKRNGTALLLFNLDLDDFKNINDTLGHSAGDALLRGMAKNLHACIRSGDTVARIGGDEFRLLAVDLAMEAAGESAHLRRQAERIATQVRSAVEVPVEVDGLHGKHMVQASTSIGVALYPHDALDALQLCRIADQRMYEDKHRRKLQPEGETGTRIVMVEA